MALQPCIEVFGRIEAWTVPLSFPGADHRSRCWLHLHYLQKGIAAMDGNI
jgi:hypothetical protein